MQQSSQYAHMKQLKKKMHVFKTKSKSIQQESHEHGALGLDVADSLLN